MALKIRLRQQGRNNRPFYRVVVADCRSPRDGKYVESVGWYNPFESELDKNLSLKQDRIQHWLGLGAQLTDSVISLLEKVAPHIVRDQTKKEVEHRAKAKAKRKARKKAAA
jgi:small subunit ribosomal protein S16